MFGKLFHPDTDHPPAATAQGTSPLSTAQLDPKQLAFFAARASAAYQPADLIAGTLHNTSRIGQIPDLGLQYVLEQDHRALHQTVSLRGTANKPNVWQDLDISLVQDDRLGIPLHHGFRQDARAIYEDLAPHLCPDLPLRITGHSLGGAIGAILAGYCHHGGFDLTRVVTFGQPKFGAAPLPDAVTTCTTRVLHAHDPVPMVPAQITHHDYLHSSEELILHHNHPPSYHNAHDATRLSLHRFWHELPLLSLKQHRITSYRASIAQLSPGFTVATVDAMPCVRSTPKS